MVQEYTSIDAASMDTDTLIKYYRGGSNRPSVGVTQPDSLLH